MQHWLTLSSSLTHVWPGMTNRPCIDLLYSNFLGNRHDFSLKPVRQPSNPSIGFNSSLLTSTLFFGKLVIHTNLLVLIRPKKIHLSKEPYLVSWNLNKTRGTIEKKKKNQYRTIHSHLVPNCRFQNQIQYKHFLNCWSIKSYLPLAPDRECKLGHLYP